MMVRRPAARVPSAPGALALSVGMFLYAFTSPPTAASSTETVQIRGHSQTLHTYGSRGGEPVIVSSGDGGWVHLGPHIAQTLAARGFFVVGFDVKTYLQGFTSTQGTLRPEDVPADYCALLEFASRGASVKPVLIGVSEGAGLSVLAAADGGPAPPQQASSASVCPITNELGWRWRDSLIYMTHGVPNEPTFSTLAVIGQVAPLPVASIHSTHDEFVSQRGGAGSSVARCRSQAALARERGRSPLQRQSRRIRRTPARGPRLGPRAAVPLRLR